MPDFENTSLCAACGGKCCKQHAGGVSPLDLGKDVAWEAYMLLLTGKYCADWWESDDTMPQTYYLRPKNKNKMDRLYDASWGGECCFLTPHGCELIFSQRPKECRSLEPRDNNEENCKQHHSKQAICKEWLAYQDDLKVVMEMMKE